MKEIYLSTTKGKFKRKILAEQVKVEGMDGYNLFIHESIDEPNMLTMTEESTGMTVYEAKTKEELIERINKLIQNIGIDKVKASIEQSKEKLKIYEDEFYCTVIECNLNLSYIECTTLKEKLIQKGIIK